jgi:hypothetical protein
VWWRGCGISKIQILNKKTVETKRKREKKNQREARKKFIRAGMVRRRKAHPPWLRT